VIQATEIEMEAESVDSDDNSELIFPQGSNNDSDAAKAGTETGTGLDEDEEFGDFDFVSIPVPTPDNTLVDTESVNCVSAQPNEVDIVQPAATAEDMKSSPMFQRIASPAQGMPVGDTEYIDPFDAIDSDLTLYETASPSIQDAASKSKMKESLIPDLDPFGAIDDNETVNETQPLSSQSTSSAPSGAMANAVTSSDNLLASATSSAVTFDPEPLVDPFEEITNDTFLEPNSTPEVAYPFEYPRGADTHDHGDEQPFDAPAAPADAVVSAIPDVAELSSGHLSEGDNPEAFQQSDARTDAASVIRDGTVAEETTESAASSSADALLTALGFDDENSAASVKGTDNFDAVASTDGCDRPGASMGSNIMPKNGLDDLTDAYRTAEFEEVKGINQGSVDCGSLSGDNTEESSEVVGGFESKVEFLGTGEAYSADAVSSEDVKEVCMSPSGSAGVVERYSEDVGSPSGSLGNAPTLSPPDVSVHEADEEWNDFGSPSGTAEAYSANDIAPTEIKEKFVDRISSSETAGNVDATVVSGVAAEEVSENRNDRYVNDAASKEAVEGTQGSPAHSSGRTDANSVGDIAVVGATEEWNDFGNRAALEGATNSHSGDDSASTNAVEGLQEEISEGWGDPTSPLERVAIADAHSASYAADAAEEWGDFDRPSENPATFGAPFSNDDASREGDVPEKRYDEWNGVTDPSELGKSEYNLPVEGFPINEANEEWGDFDSPSGVPAASGLDDGVSNESNEGFGGVTSSMVLADSPNTSSAGVIPVEEANEEWGDFDSPSGLPAAVDANSRRAISPKDVNEDWGDFGGPSALMQPGNECDVKDVAGDETNEEWGDFDSPPELPSTSVVASNSTDDHFNRVGESMQTAPQDEFGAADDDWGDFNDVPSETAPASLTDEQQNSSEQKSFFGSFGDKESGAKISTEYFDGLWDEHLDQVHISADNS
jgi:hypothetical protein